KYVEKTRREPRRSLKKQYERRKSMDEPNNPNQSVTVPSGPTLRTGASFRSGPPEDRSRYDWPASKSAPPEDKFGQGPQSGSNKNGTVEWYKCDGLEDDVEQSQVTVRINSVDVAGQNPQTDIAECGVRAPWSSFREPLDSSGPQVRDGRLTVRDSDASNSGEK